MSGGPTEQETCRDLVLPRLAANGWEGDGNSRIVPEFPIVAGRGPGRLGRRRADYLLEVRPGLAGAVIEAKRAYTTDELASQQAVARSVLTALLDQYARQGPQVLDDLRALELQPFRQYGSLIDIAGYFGGGQGLRDAVSQVGSWIYSA